jgi:hypothetical protein
VFIHPAFRALLALALALSPWHGGAQQAPQGWNEARVLDLVTRARSVRHDAFVDSAFRSYRADARGYVYFFIDRPGSEERNLIKTDQIAIEMYWRAPDETRQRIVGLRDRELLPTNVRYHLDHLTVVQDDFADVIRLGDGDEVSAVVHPAAPGSESVYDFRLADSLTISFPGSGAEPVRVYEVEVRPRDFSRPGFLGSVFLDLGTGAIVRMSFTFTPASYVDPYLDYIRISLDNSLWEGKYWLPYRQEAELRRELPQLDFVGGSVIRGRFEIGAYEINADLPETVFRAPRVSAVPTVEREAFPFERPLFDQLEEQGLDPPPSLEEIRRQAREMVASRYLSGLSRVRLHLPTLSDGFRYNRAEGAFVGTGAVLRPTGALTLRGQVGYGFASGHVAGALRIGGSEPGRGPSLALYANQLRDLGPVPASEGILNTLSVLVAGQDYLDPWFASGVGLTLPFALGPLDGTASLSAERHRSAALEVDDDDGSFRPVRPVDEGDGVFGTVTLAPRLGRDWSAAAHVRTGALDGEAFVTTRIEAGWSRDAAWRELNVALAAAGGVTSANSPSQELFLLGGRGTMLGHPYRSFVGDRFWLVDARVSQSLAAPWLTGRVFTSAGWTRLAHQDLPTGWTGDGAASVKASAGVGLGLAWDVLHVDLGRGLGSGGGWAVSVSASRRFRGWL